MPGFASTVGWPLSAFLEGHFGWRGACLVWAGLHVVVGLPLNRLLIPKAPGIGVGEYEGVVRVSRRVFQILLLEALTPERCLEAYHLHRTRLELIAERKVRRRQLTDDGNDEINGRDLREREIRASHPRPIGYRRAAS